MLKRTDCKAAAITIARVCKIAIFGCYTRHRKWGAHMEHWSKNQGASASVSVEDAQDIAAGLLLRRVEAMLRDGQPRQAIAHICDMTGVDRSEAEAFVAHLKVELFP
jgi:hypothetical protein